MAQAAITQSSFAGGEWSEKAQARVDLQRYREACSKLENYVPIPTGGHTRRPGFRFAGEVKFPTRFTRLIAYEFGDEQDYILEFGHEYIRIWKDHGIVTSSPKTITAATKANPCQITSTSHGFSNGDRVIIAGVGGMVELNNREFIVAGAATNTFTLQDTTGTAVNSTGYTTYTSGGTASKIYEVSTDYDEDELRDLGHAQSFDVMFITHVDHAPATLTRVTDSPPNWTLDALDIEDGPYLDTNRSATTMTCASAAAPGSTCTVTASSTDGVNDGAGFTASDVGRLFRITNGQQDEWAWGEITAVADTTHFTLTVKGRDSVGTSARLEWRLGVYGPAIGYPAVVEFHEDRLVFGRPKPYPQRIDGSVVGDYSTFEPTKRDPTSGLLTSAVSPDVAYSFTLASRKVNAIRWMRTSSLGLLIGTKPAEWVLSASSQNEALTPDNVAARVFSRYGSSSVPAVELASGFLFLQRTGRALLEAAPDQNDRFQTQDLSVLADHLLEDGAVDLAAQAAPYSLAWVARGDGSLAACAYARAPDSVSAGWTDQQVGGNGSGVTVESLAAIPDPTGSYDELWMVAKRHIHGRDVRFIEYMTEYDRAGIAQEDLCLLDASLTYDGAETSVVSGLFHLEGETVSVMGDGAKQADAVVAGGKITLEAAASVVHVGYGYASRGRNLPYEAGGAKGSVFRKKLRISKACLSVVRTLGIKIGPTFDKLKLLPTRDQSVGVGEASPLFTGELDVVFNGPTERRTMVCWEQSDPYPGTIRALAVDLTAEEDG